MIHDKADNAAQVSAIVALLTGTGTYQLNWGDTYPVNIHHVIPSGVSVNISSLNGTSTEYATNQNSNVHFNRAYMRGSDASGDVVVIVRDASLLTVYEIVGVIAALTGNKCMITTPGAYYMSYKGIQWCGIIDESTAFSTAMTNYQTHITDLGYTYG